MKNGVPGSFGENNFYWDSAGPACVGLGCPGGSDREPRDSAHARPLNGNIQLRRIGRPELLVRDSHIEQTGRSEE